jgi:nicotinate dehydrogenase subunit A
MHEGAMATFTLQINNRTASIESWDPAQPLLYAIRSTGLIGSKIGCGLGQCGTCTVLMDKQPVRACMVPISAAAGHAITTIEGVGTPQRPDPIQRAFIAEQAAQCGYCTTGMIMSAKALLMRTPKPTVEQIKEALAGNLCRCGAYTRIIRAVQRAADGRG